MMNYTYCWTFHILQCISRLLTLITGTCSLKDSSGHEVKMVGIRVFISPVFSYVCLLYLRYRNVEVYSI